MAQFTPHRVGLYFAIVQFFFTLTWTVYVIFLPRLAVEAGIPKSAVVYILLGDQLIFMIMDFAMGAMADRVSRVLGKVGYAVLAITLVSCLAFLVLPFLAPKGSPALFLAATALWTASSSVLRAPPLMLLGKYAPEPSVPWLSALSLFGLGVAGAISPYLTIVLRDADARLPFVLSSVALALATAGIIWAERTLVEDRAPAQPAPTQSRGTPAPAAVGFLIAVLLLGLGFQIHFALNSAGLYARYASADRIAHLMPVFWIGFNVLMLPASLATKRYGGVAVAGAGALIASLASFFAVNASDLNTVIAMQLVAGGGWGCVLMSAVAAALAIGHTGREGKLIGALFSLLALAAAARIAIVIAELNKDADFAALLTWTPVAAWCIGGFLLLLLVRAERKPASVAPA